MIRFLAIVATLASIGLPAIAQERPARSPAEEKVLRGLILLPHERQLEVLKRLGIKPDGGFLDCLCRSAGYGSSSTQQFYHPDTIGDYNPAYSCTQPGPPCVVSGFGCLRYPLPTNGNIWESCSIANRPEGGKTILDSILAGAAARGEKKAPDVQRALTECRANWENQIDSKAALAPYDGYDYLAANGVPVLPPPQKLAAKMKTEADRVQAKIAERLRESQKAAEEAVEEESVAKTLEGMAKNQDNYIAAATLAMELTELEMGALRRETEQRKKAWEDLRKTLKPGDEGKYAHEIYRADMAKLDKQKKQYERDQKHLTEFMLAAEIAGDLPKAAEQLKKLYGGDARKKIGALNDATETMKKYLDKYREYSAEKGADLMEAVKDKGLSPEQFAAYEKMVTKGEVLEGVSQAAQEAMKYTSWGLKAYDGFQQFKKDLAEVERLSSKGNYTAAQRNLLLAFEGMSRLTEAGAGYMPPGVSDMMQFYAEAMKTPAQMDAIMREIINRSDVHAERTGDQANTPAMNAYIKAHPGVSLEREDYLYRKAGLSAYRMDNFSGDRPYVLIPRADGQPIYLSEANYQRLMEAAYYYPIAEGRRMTDADVFDMLWNLPDSGSVNIDALRKKAEEKLKSSAVDQRIADRFGQKSISFEDSQLWWEFEKAMSAALPAKCVLDPQTQARLFGSYREQARRGEVLDYLNTYGAKLKLADLPQPAKAGGN